MRPLSRLTLALLLVVFLASPTVARVAMIETTAPLRDHAEPSIQTAFKEALQTAIRGAVAMGLSWVKLNQALVLENMVSVQLLATDTKPEGEEGGEEEEEPWQGGEAGAWSGQLEVRGL